MWTLLCRIPLAPASMYWCAPGGTQDYINVMHCWQASLSLTTLAQELQQEGIEYTNCVFLSTPRKTSQPVQCQLSDTIVRFRGFTEVEHEISFSAAAIVNSPPASELRRTTMQSERSISWAWRWGAELMCQKKITHQQLYPGYSLVI